MSVAYGPEKPAYRSRGSLAIPDRAADRTRAEALRARQAAEAAARQAAEDARQATEAALKAELERQHAEEAARRLAQQKAELERLQREAEAQAQREAAAQEAAARKEQEKRDAEENRERERKETCNTKQLEFAHRYACSWEDVQKDVAFHADLRKRSVRGLANCYEEGVIKPVENICNEDHTQEWDDICSLGQSGPEVRRRDDFRLGSLGMGNDVIFIVEKLRESSLSPADRTSESEYRDTDLLFAYDVRHPDRREPQLLGHISFLKTESDGFAALRDAYPGKFKDVKLADGPRAGTWEAYAYATFLRATRNAETSSKTTWYLERLKKKLYTDHKDRQIRTGQRVGLYIRNNRWVVDEDGTVTEYDVPTMKKSRSLYRSMDAVRAAAVKNGMPFQELDRGAPRWNDYNTEVLQQRFEEVDQLDAPVDVMLPEASPQ